MDEQEIKNKRLDVASAAEWANERLSLRDLKTSLRSTELKSTFELFSRRPTEKQKSDLVVTLCQKRTDILRRSGCKFDCKLDGRILCFYLSVLGDGLSHDASYGFFSEEEEQSPWDTWLFYEVGDVEGNGGWQETCLYSWVPSPIVPMINEIIDDDPHNVWIWAKKLEKKLGINV